MISLSHIIACNNSIDNKFDLLADSIQNCRLCTCMESRTKVFSENNGNIHSNMLIIAEAPGRLGADRTAIPLFGDQTGSNFQHIIDMIGWTREDFFITNAILCNPRDENGNNATPKKENIKNCIVYLDILIKIMNPEYIVTLGQKAIDALQLIEPVKVTLKSNVRTIMPWNGRFLIPLYHTGPRAMVHRSYYNQLADFYWVKQKVTLCSKPWQRMKDVGLTTKIKNAKFSLLKLHKVIIEILDRSGPLTDFQLTKLLYLTDYNYMKISGKPLTNAFYLRAYEGPLPMGLDKQLPQLFQQGILARRENLLYLSSKPKVTLKKEELSTIESVLKKYGKMSNAEIKTVTYMTNPMRRILRKEKKGEKMLWKPVFNEDDFRM